MTDIITTSASSGYLDKKRHFSYPSSSAQELEVQSPGFKTAPPEHSRNFQKDNDDCHTLRCVSPSFSLNYASHSTSKTGNVHLKISPPRKKLKPSMSTLIDGNMKKIMNGKTVGNSVMQTAKNDNDSLFHLCTCSDQSPVTNPDSVKKQTELKEMKYDNHLVLNTPPQKMEPSVFYNDDRNDSLELTDLLQDPRDTERDSLFMETDSFKELNIIDKNAFDEETYINSPSTSCDDSFSTNSTSSNVYTRDDRRADDLYCEENLSFLDPPLTRKHTTSTKSTKNKPQFRFNINRSAAISNPDKEHDFISLLSSGVLSINIDDMFLPDLNVNVESTFDSPSRDKTGRVPDVLVVTKRSSSLHPPKSIAIS